MGVVNVTPDSFSDGGLYADPADAIAHGLKLISQGAELLDIGGESTRPGADSVAEDEELRRVLPVIEGLQGKGAALSIDTMKPAVARAAIAAGATMWNDVSALAAPGALEAAAALNCRVVLMHMQGNPQTMQQNPSYEDPVREVGEFLAVRAQAAVAAGVRREHILVDPGIGFGKALEHNLSLLANLENIVALGFPVVLGVSRKRFVRAIDPTAEDPRDRIGGSIAAALRGADAGVAILRAHDVRETVQALKVWEAMRS